MKKSKIQSPRIPSPIASYSQGILAEGRKIFFISGQGPLDADGNLVGKGDMAAQTHQVFRNIRSQLEEAGADFSNVIKITIFLTEMDKFREFTRVREEYLKDPYPAASLFGVTRLVHPDWLVEVEAIALLD